MFPFSSTNRLGMSCFVFVSVFLGAFQTKLTANTVIPMNSTRMIGNSSEAEFKDWTSGQFNTMADRAKANYEVVDKMRSSLRFVGASIGVQKVNHYASFKVYVEANATIEYELVAILEDFIKDAPHGAPLHSFVAAQLKKHFRKVEKDNPTDKPILDLHALPYWDLNQANRELGVKIVIKEALMDLFRNVNLKEVKDFGLISKSNNLQLEKINYSDISKLIKEMLKLKLNQKPIETEIISVFAADPFARIEDIEKRVHAQCQELHEKIERFETFAWRTTKIKGLHLTNTLSRCIPDRDIALEDVKQLVGPRNLEATISGIGLNGFVKIKRTYEGRINKLDMNKMIGSPDLAYNQDKIIENTSRIGQFSADQVFDRIKEAQIEMFEMNQSLNRENFKIILQGMDKSHQKLFRTIALANQEVVGLINKSYEEITKQNNQIYTEVLRGNEMHKITHKSLKGLFELGMAQGEQMVALRMKLAQDAQNRMIGSLVRTAVIVGSIAFSAPSGGTSLAGLAWAFGGTVGAQVGGALGEAGAHLLTMGGELAAGTFEQLGTFIDGTTDVLTKLPEMLNLPDSNEILSQINFLEVAPQLNFADGGNEIFEGLINSAREASLHSMNMASSGLEEITTEIGGLGAKFGDFFGSFLDKEGLTEEAASANLEDSVDVAQENKFWNWYRAKTETTDAPEFVTRMMLTKDVLSFGLGAGVTSVGVVGGGLFAYNLAKPHILKQKSIEDWVNDKVAKKREFRLEVQTSMEIQAFELPVAILYLKDGNIYDVIDLHGTNGSYSKTIIVPENREFEWAFGTRQRRNDQMPKILSANLRKISNDQSADTIYHDYYGKKQSDLISNRSVEVTFAISDALKIKSKKPNFQPVAVVYETKDDSTKFVPVTFGELLSSGDQYEWNSYLKIPEGKKHVIKLMYRYGKESTLQDFENPSVDYYEVTDSQQDIKITWEHQMRTKGKSVESENSRASKQNNSEQKFQHSNEKENGTKTENLKISEDFEATIEVDFRSFSGKGHIPKYNYLVDIYDSIPITDAGKLNPDAKLVKRLPLSSIEENLYQGKYQLLTSKKYYWIIAKILPSSSDKVMALPKYSLGYFEIDGSSSDKSVADLK